MRGTRILRWSSALLLISIGCLLASAKPSARYSKSYAVDNHVQKSGCKEDSQDAKGAKETKLEVKTEAAEGKDTSFSTTTAATTTPTSSSNAPASTSKTTTTAAAPSSSPPRCVGRRQRCEQLCASFDPETLSCARTVESCQDVCVRWAFD